MVGTALSTFIINMDRDTERLHNVSRQFERAGLRFTREPAVDGTAVPNDLRPYFFDTCKTSLKPGEIGCYASHLSIMRRIVEHATAPVVLICEDDIEIPSDFATIVDEVLEKVLSGWDIIRLSSRPKRAVVPVVTLTGGRSISLYSKGPVGTGAYLINRSGARKFLLPEVRTRAIDNDMKRGWHFGHKMYGVVPPPAVQVPGRTSTIRAMGGRRKGVGGLRRAGSVTEIA